MSTLGRTLVIANPVAHAGRGRRGARAVVGLLRSRPEVTDYFDLKLTTAEGDATALAEQFGPRYDTLLALGGDGLVHEVVGGLMRLCRSERPTLGLIPLGSGNDYARTLGIAANSPRLALDQLLEGARREVEVGRVNDVHFMETLSFGVDAAIALEARVRHAEGNASLGLGHYADAGIRLFSQAQEGWAYRARFDGGEAEGGRALVFAVQVGESYGGGFRICPRANPTDGRLDVCYTQGSPSVPKALALFGRARFGGHTGSDAVVLRCARTLELEFDERPPAQVDGEPLTGTKFSVEVVPDALTVIAGRRVRW